MNNPDSFLPCYLSEGRIELQHCRAMKNAMGDIRGKALFKFSGAAIEHHEEWIEITLTVECLQLTEDPGPISSRPRQVAIRQDKIQRAIPMVVSTFSAADF